MPIIVELIAEFGLLCLLKIAILNAYFRWKVGPYPKGSVERLLNEGGGW